MFNLRSSRATFAGLIFLAGCGGEMEEDYISQGPLPPGYVAPASTEHLPLVDHPEYVNWSKFLVGTEVVRKKEVSNDVAAVRVTTTLRLAEKTAHKVVVESQVTVDRSGEPLVKNPPQKFDFPAKFRLPDGMKLEQFLLPSLKAEQIGEELRVACGQDFNTQLFTWDERNETGPMKVKLWRSDDIPGRMLRQEINGHMHFSVEEVVEIRQPAKEARHGSWQQRPSTRYLKLTSKEAVSISHFARPACQSSERSFCSWSRAFTAWPC
jgi:hypothetical protein